MDLAHLVCRVNASLRKGKKLPTLSVHVTLIHQIAAALQEQGYNVDTVFKHVRVHTPAKEFMKNFTGDFYALKHNDVVFGLYGAQGWEGILEEYKTLSPSATFEVLSNEKLGYVNGQILSDATRQALTQTLAQLEKEHLMEHMPEKSDKPKRVM
jgi:hypothetical protein